MDTTEHDMAEQNTAEADGLTIFDDVHEVRDERVAFVGLQLMAVVLSYSFALGILVIVLVPVVLALTLLWPYLPSMLFPQSAGL
ncbi:hypothetical protein [Cryobacterium sp. N22]|uniref:hypothetical protein n=1 Tax=Cryobacterium sp. N22 TaxID=2048290 RepID=UPI0011B005D2|nr:hypothetical protein [Cryobacterium sp. N22]